MLRLIRKLAAAMIWLPVLLWGILPSQAATLQLNQISSPVVLGEALDYLEDPDGSLSVLDIQHDTRLDWQHSNARVPNHGYTSSAYWYRLQVENTSTMQQYRLLEVGYALLDEVDFFLLSDGLIRNHYETGDQRPFANRPIEHRNFIFPVSLAPGQQATILLRIRTQSSHQVPVTLASETAFFVKDQERVLGQALYYGMMLVMILFNLFLYVSLRERVYLYYIAFVFSFAMVQLHISGFPAQYLWKTMPAMQDQMLLFFVPCITLFTSLFTRNFLDTATHAPFADRFFRVMTWLSWLAIGLSLLLPYEASIKLSLAIVIPTSTACLVTGPVLWARGHTIARFYSIAWFCITLAALALAFSKFGWIPRTFLTEHGLQFGSAMEAVLLSMALADRLNAEREHRFRVQARLLEESRQREKAENRLMHAALHHPLTGLPNRTYFENWFGSLSQKGFTPGSLMLGIIHLRRFHEVNKTLGHLQADALLMKISQILNTRAANMPGLVALESDGDRRWYLFALEGVSFGMLLDSTRDPEVVKHFETLARLAAEPFEFNDLNIDAGGVAGLSGFAEAGQDGATLIRHAQIAVDVGAREKALVTCYSDALNPYNARRLRLAGELRRALQNDQLSLYFQPKVCLRTGSVNSLEALLRWHHPELGFVPPDEFIPIAEKTGIIHALTEWVIRKAVATVAEMTAQGLPLSVAVNISPVNLKEPDFVQRLQAILDSHQVPACLLILEITETAMMADPARALSVMKGLDEMGVRLSIDDFGTGYSSFSYIRDLPVREVKIDRSFVMKLDQNESDRVIVRTMINMCHDLGFEVVAEGVENRAISEALRDMGSDYLQGYHFSRPLPFSQLEQWLVSHRQVLSEDSGAAPSFRAG
ncbi:EAL domain-containing protein [Hahella sp. SMD15-11]|uniref:cyclic-guanylate-specific phosphodiesterase n=1 Tax=Thermohahella caldifontis TaxID=3142973 RepID=A0AB39UT19_9GAMM